MHYITFNPGGQENTFQSHSHLAKTVMPQF